VPYVENDGVRIHYQVEGEGPPLFLHTGFTVGMLAWYEWGYVDALKDHYRLVLIDPRGHGKSDKPHDSAAYQAAHRVGDVVAILDDLGVARTHYLGYSMGGRIGFEVAQLAPSRLLSLMIGGATPDATVNQAERNAQWFGDGMQAFLDRQPLPDHIKTPTFRAEMLSNDPQALIAVGLDRPSIEDVLPTLTVPCLIYAGDADPVRARAETYVSLIPDATFVSLPGIDHWAGISRSDLVLPHVRAFLDHLTRQ
jgi:pimeloyl-ACP methyl ester carboxylesterase